jgi:glycosyltransferase involved in cell wall biosynthesis
MRKKSVCYILSYYSPNYIRTRTLVQALQLINDIELNQARNSSEGFFRYFQTLWKLIIIRVLKNPEFYILGFRGYEFFWFVRVITLGKSLIFDHMMSPYDSLINEKKIIKKYSLLAKLVYLYEKSILLSCNLILTDTELHKRYFEEIFLIKPQKIVAIPVSTDEDIFYPKEISLSSSKNTLFEVLYYGSFLPLHGIDIILRAAEALLDHPIHFTLIGGNRLDLSDFHREIKDHKIYNIDYVSWVEFEKLPHFIDHANLGLGGPFGNTGQARRVITGKTFQFLAKAKPVVVGQIDEECGFEDKVNCLVVPQQDKKSLAKAIFWAFQNEPELKQIGRRGYELYQSRYSVRKNSDTLLEILKIL